MTRRELTCSPSKRAQRKDDIAHQYLADFNGDEGVLFVAKAQEKTTTFRTEKRTNPYTGRPYPWIVRASAMVNHYYFVRHDVARCE